MLFKLTPLHARVSGVPGSPAPHGPGRMGAAGVVTVSQGPGARAIEKGASS